MTKTPELKNYRVFLIDDHPLTCAGLRRVVESEEGLEVCGTSETGKGAIDFLGQSSPDILLLDLSLKDCSGLEVIKDLRAAGFSQPILVISMHDERLYGERVLKAGANGYLMKDEATDTVAKAIFSILKGEVYLSHAMREEVVQRMVGCGGKKPAFLLDQLTDRKFEIFQLIGRGIPPTEIAEYLVISPKTVDAHRSNLRQKLGLKSAPDLLRFAVRWSDGGAMSEEEEE